MLKTHLKRIRRIIKRHWVRTLVGAIGFFVLFFGGWFVYIWITLPAPSLLATREVAESTKIYDRTGEVLLYEVYGEERRTVIPLEKISPVVRAATLAAEDANFYNHAAFDFRSIIRAALVNLRRGGIVQGGSTITQQLAKKAFLTDARTPTRKLKELVLSIRLEQQFTKDQILEAYLNQIPYGSNAYGIEAASQTFFGKHASELDIAEAATIAGIPRAPSYYSPFGPNREALVGRRDYILEQMKANGSLSEEDYTAAIKEEPKFAPPSRGIRAPHFVMAVLQQLNARYGEDFVRTAGLKVTTTLDWKLQERAEQAVSEGAEKNESLYGGTNAALVAEDATTGQVLALVGSRNYFDTDHEGNFDVASQGLRQPGSAMKPLVYAAAFEKGYTPDTVVFDLDTEFSTENDPEKSYRPADFDGKYRGPITLRNALAQSLNIPAVKVLYLVGMDNALQTLRSFGLSTLTERSRYGLSLVLGGGEVRLIDLTHAYSVLAQEGIKHDQAIILQVTQGDKTLEAYEDSSERVIDAQTTRLVSDVLSDAQARAPVFGTSLNLPSVTDHQVAVKTGTSQDYRDAWAVGYTPSLVVGVWAGNNDNTPMRHGESIRAAAPIWRAFIQPTLLERPAESFSAPDPIYTDKPMLKGQWLVNYEANGVTYPQVHDILFYLKKDDPQGPDPINPSSDAQFDNWEAPINAWVAANVPNAAFVNQPLPIGSTIQSSSAVVSGNAGINLTLTTPTNGSFIGAALQVDAQASSDVSLTKLELYFNGTLVDTRVGDLGTNPGYHFTYVPTSPDPQNLLSLVATDSKGRTKRQDVIVFGGTN